MNLQQNIQSRQIAGPYAAGLSDTTNAWFAHCAAPDFREIRVGVVEQFNVGMYSALVSEGSNGKYMCLIGSQQVTPSFGYGDITTLREGDEVIFAVPSDDSGLGMILARKPTLLARDSDSKLSVKAENNQTRRSHFFGNDCYVYDHPVYSIPPTDQNDLSVRGLASYRPSDLVSGECGTINQHRCGWLGQMYSMSILGGGAFIKLFSIENRIRIVADSIIKSTLCGNENEWHNAQYLSSERSCCLYQDERMGLAEPGAPFKEADYFKDGYYTKNSVDRQTARPRILEQEGYFGGLSTRYCIMPDPTDDEIRSMDSRPTDLGVSRESIDPAGQYRLAATGMLGLERIGRIPVPHRMFYPWQVEAKTPKGESLTPFKHDENHPFYRQLELADRVAYDLKNSYARLDESEEFYTPEEKDLDGLIEDTYDPGFTGSKTVYLKKYDKRRSGIWQGEDGSIILRDAWGSEIVMIGGNIQLSCPGNIEVLPGKSALTLAGDDIIIKAQNSIDIEAADKDVRINGYKNVQILGGNESTPGGVTIESKGKANPWDAKAADGGEAVKTSGILLKSAEGSIVTDTDTLVMRSNKWLSLVCGEEDIDGNIFITGKNVYTHGETIISVTGDAAMLLSEVAAIAGQTAYVAGVEGAGVFSQEKYLVPLTTVDAGSITEDTLASVEELVEILKDEEKVSKGYSRDDLDNMSFKFRSSDECDTMSSWELSGPSNFTLYEPFWVQVASKFETLKDASVSTKNFDDHPNDWGDSTGNPWPGADALAVAKYAMLSSVSPVNMDGEGMNVARDAVVDKSSIKENKLFPGYKIRA